MNPEALKKENLPGNTPSEKRAARRQLVAAEQRAGTPPIVPAAIPPTTMAEVPPATAPIRAAPARYPGDGGSNAAHEAQAAQEEGITPLENLRRKQGFESIETGDPAAPEKFRERAEAMDRSRVR